MKAGIAKYCVIFYLECWIFSDQSCYWLVVKANSFYVMLALCDVGFDHLIAPFFFIIDSSRLSYGGKSCHSQVLALVRNRDSSFQQHLLSNGLIPTT